MTDRFLQSFSPAVTLPRVVAGIVPHAGWRYSGAVAAQVFESIRRSTHPATFVFFGAAHRWNGPIAVYARGAWETPQGNLEVDHELAAAILDRTAGLATDDPSAHVGEHAIEVELPFVKHLFPEAKIVPIAVGPDQNAVPFGRQTGKLLNHWKRPVAVIGSSDLTHYGDIYRFAPAGYGSRAHEWMQANDRRMVDRAVRMEAAEIIPESLRHHNACGPGAIAATVAAASEMSAERGHLMNYTTSFDVAPDYENAEFRMAVGYAGILY
jgi:AmmeMemoRadiSam system protein B